MDRNTIYLLLGGNLPDRITWMNLGLEAIAATCGTIILSSGIYETAAWGKEDQEPFLNRAIALDTDLAPLALLAAVNKIEASLGRQRDEKWGSRTLDIDILFYGDQIIDLPTLKVPHPYLQERRFALVPLCEIAPGFIHPTLRKSVKQLLDECKDPLRANIFQQTS